MKDKSKETLDALWERPKTKAAVAAADADPESISNTRPPLSEDELVRCTDCGEYRSVRTDDQGLLVSAAHVCK